MYIIFLDFNWLPLCLKSCEFRLRFPSNDEDVSRDCEVAKVQSYQATTISLSNYLSILVYCICKQQCKLFMNEVCMSMPEQLGHSACWISLDIFLLFSGNNLKL
jgi:hypothetical protein